MTSIRSELRRFVRHTLVGATSVASADASQLVAAFNSLCERLNIRLHALFGVRAVSALLARAVHLAATEFPWVTDLIPDSGHCAVIEAAGTPPISNLEEGLAAVLTHEIELLSAFVGEDLILPIVQDAWGAVRIGEDRQERR